MLVPWEVSAPGKDVELQTAPSLLTPNSQELVNPGKDGKVTSGAVQQVKGAWEVSALEESTGCAVIRNRG